MVEFKLRHHNRIKFPTHKIWIVEDDLDAQANFVAWAKARFEPQGQVQFDFMASGIIVASALLHLTPNLIILDHDLPYGNASDLMQWMKENGKTDIPIITASGWEPNLDHMMNLGQEYGIEMHRFMKYEVYQGKADNLILEILRRGDQESRINNGVEKHYQA